MEISLSLRQQDIVKLLNKERSLSRAQINNALSKQKPVSRPTIIRDLNILIEHNLIISEGTGRKTVYTLAQKHPLLAYVNINDYFSVDQYERIIQTNYDKTIFDNLHNLFSSSEKKLFDNSLTLYKKRTSTLNSSLYKRELERFIIELAWKSSQIEGNTYSIIEAESLIKQNIEAHGHSKGEAIMILNHKVAFEKILEGTEQFKHITTKTILDLHLLMTKDLVAPGIRSARVRISGTVYTPLSKSDQLKQALEQFVNKINSIAYPPEKALVTACMIAYLQPFNDGNKRTSRMLANAILLAYGYYPLSYRNINVNEYRGALLLFYEQNNLYHFKRLFIEQYKFAMNNYF